MNLINIESRNKLSIEDAKFDISCSDIMKLKKLDCTDVEIIGQERAIESLKMGRFIEEDGYNVFVIGESGTGRRTAIKNLLSSFEPKKENLQDLAYAFNFKNPSEPILLCFPRGRANEFNVNLQRAIKNIRVKILRMIKSGILFHENTKMKEIAELEEVKNIAKFEAFLKERGFKAIDKKEGDAIHPTIYPLYKGKPISFLKLQKLVITGKIEERIFDEIKASYPFMLDELHKFLSHLNNVENKLKKAKKEKEISLLKPIIKEELKKVFDLLEKYDTLCKCESQKTCNLKVKTFIKNVEKDLCKKMKILSTPFKNHKMYADFMGRYEINIIYRNTKDKSYIIDEPITHFAELFGTIEVDPEGSGRAKNGHLKIKEGAIHKALNGYIILRLETLLKEEDSWEYLKNILLSRKIKIPCPARSSHSPFIVKPEAIENVPKVIMIGDEMLYNLLAQEETDFYKLFKIVAHFDSSMLRNEENTAKFLALISNLQKKQGVLPLKDSAYSRLILFSSELADSRLLLSTQFTKIADCLNEANYIAKTYNSSFISEKEIGKAIEKKEYLNSLEEEKFLDMLKMKNLIIEVKEKTIARVNGLAIEETGQHSFGLPIAITAQVSCGMGGVIDIEKEVGLSGEIYDKAHLIITSLLRQRFLKHYPLCISASVCSEQSYSFIDGDSASCAHFLSLISAIGEIPMRQDIAVTGSLNQLGEVQAVGGISQKIKGFFNACKILGFTGKGGVVIPESNKQNLFLNDEILKAIKESTFNIWVIKNIDDAIALLTGMKKEEYSAIIEEKLTSFAKTIMEMNHSF